MKITAITRYKHGALFEVLRKIGWNQSELARRAGLRAETISEIINLNKRPSQKSANAIQAALAEAGEFFDVLEQWPEAFQGIKRGMVKEETIDVPMERLIDCREAMLIPAPEQDQEEWIGSALDECLSFLTKKESRVIQSRFYEAKTLQETAKDLGIASRTRIAQIEEKAIRKLRHSFRAKDIRELSQNLQ